MNSKNAPLIAVTGLGRGENPQPGFAVVSSLRRRWPSMQIAGLAYDTMESGIYAEGHPDAVFTIPYPSCGTETVLQRLTEIRKEFPFTVLIPTLDAELEPLLAAQDALKALGVRILMPDAPRLKARCKKNLPQLAECAGVQTPRTFVAADLDEVMVYAKKIEGPVMIKGPFYEAYRALNTMQAAGFASRIFAEWGGPVLVQQCIEGEEFDVLAVGDGIGGTLGSCALRKLVISSCGKGYAGMTVQDSSLMKCVAALMQELRWEGPLELEFLRNRSGEYCLIEINPRFPAWADFPSALGCNLVAMAVEHFLDWPLCAPSPIQSGKIFLRHNVDIVCDALNLGALTMEGKMIHSPGL